MSGKTMVIGAGIGGIAAGVHYMEAVPTASSVHLTGIRISTGKSKGFIFAEEASLQEEGYHWNCHQPVLLPI